MTSSNTPNTPSQIRLVFCIKLKKEAPGFTSPPYPGELGERLYKHVSKEAWQLWLKHQVILINENRLNLTDPKSRSFLVEELEKYFFGEGKEEKGSSTSNKL